MTIANDAKNAAAEKSPAGCRRLSNAIGPRGYQVSERNVLGGPGRWRRRSVGRQALAPGFCVGSPAEPLWLAFRRRCPTGIERRLADLQRSTLIRNRAYAPRGVYGVVENPRGIDYSATVMAEIVATNIASAMMIGAADDTRAGSR